MSQSIIKKKSKKLERDKRTFDIMLRIFCMDHHNGNGDLCLECLKLAQYAEHRLEKCPYQENKPTCDKCPVHCYQPQMRQQMREIMRYSGPRMLYRHPALAVLHLLKSRRTLPERPKTAGKEKEERKNENGRKD